MTTRHRSHVDACIAELLKHGAEVLGEDWDHPHPRVLFRWAGKEQFYVCARSPSDRRGPRKVRANVRHILGVASRPKKVGVRRVRKNYSSAAAAAAPTTITSRPDPFDVLLGHDLGKAEATRRLDAAIAGLWSDVKASLGLFGPWLEQRPTHRRAA